MNLVKPIVFVIAIYGFNQVKSDPTSCYTCSNWDTCNDEQFDHASIPKINCESAKEQLLRSGENFQSLLFNNLKLNAMQTTTVKPISKEENRAVADAHSQAGETTNNQNSEGSQFQSRMDPSNRSWGLDKYIYQMIKENIDRNNMEMTCFKNIIHAEFGNLTMRHCFPKIIGRTEDLCTFVTRLERNNRQMNTECFVCEGDNCNSASSHTLSILIYLFSTIIFYLMK